METHPVLAKSQRSLLQLPALKLKSEARTSGASSLNVIHRSSHSEIVKVATTRSDCEMARST
jgi:hypothetical protein